MVESDRESYVGLQVDRPILSGADSFLGKVSELGAKTLGTFIAGALPQLTFDSEESLSGDVELGEPITSLTPFSQPLFDVYSSRELRLILFRKVAPEDKAKQYNFQQQAAQLTAKRRQSARKDHEKFQKLPLKSVQDRMDDISSAAGMNPRDGVVHFDSLVLLEDPANGSELALTPKAGSIGSVILHKQAKLSFREIKRTASKIAYAAGAITPTLPFIGLPEDVKPRQLERFIEVIEQSNVLPVRLVIGGISVRPLSITGRKNAHSDT